MKKTILKFLKELRDADPTIQNIFISGSCFRLYKILKTLFPGAEPYYSHLDGHWVTKIFGSYYDINGKISKQYIKDKNYELQTEKTILTSAYIPTKNGISSVSYAKYKT